MIGNGNPVRSDILRPDSVPDNCSTWQTNDSINESVNPVSSMVRGSAGKKASSYMLLTAGLPPLIIVCACGILLSS
jgi:hypothetical protein